MGSPIGQREIPYLLHAEGVPETVELPDGSRASAERKIVGKSITFFYKLCGQIFFIFSLILL